MFDNNGILATNMMVCCLYTTLKVDALKCSGRSKCDSTTGSSNVGGNMSWISFISW